MHVFQQLIVWGVKIMVFLFLWLWFWVFGYSNIRIGSQFTWETKVSYTRISLLNNYNTGVKRYHNFLKYLEFQFYSIQYKCYLQIWFVLQYQIFTLEFSLNIFFFHKIFNICFTIRGKLKQDIFGRVSNNLGWRGGVWLQALMIYEAKKIYLTSRPFPRHCFFSLDKIQITKLYQLFLLYLWTQNFKFIYTLPMQAAFTKHKISLSTLLLTFKCIWFYAVIYVKLI